MYVRILLFISIMILSSYSQDHNAKTKRAQQSPTPDQRGTKQSPLVIKPLKPDQTDEEINRDEEERKNKSKNDGNIVKLTAALALIALGQLGIYAYQAQKLRQTVKSAEDQSKATERHIGEAERSANAMEEIAATIDKGNKDFARAYLVVVIGGAIYQQRREGQDDLFFEANPTLINTGSTPARKVSFSIAVDILPVPIPEDFTFPIPETEVKDAGLVGPHQQHGLAATLNRFVPDDEVQAIKEGKDRALCVWGLVTYEDMYGKPHSTKFGQWLTWWPNGRVFGYYLAGQNDFD
jgi:hypothetical protein